MVCGLCNSDKELKESHIIPRFILRWIGGTSATGYLRSPLNPNLRLQDAMKQKLLCGDCELTLSKWENKFAKEVFYPYQKTLKGSFSFSFPYEEWLIRFVVSLAWRTALEAEEVKHMASRQKKNLEDALEIWRKYLLGESSGVGIYEHHIFLAGPIEDSTHSGIPGRFNHYMMRSVDFNPFHSQKGTVGLYMKLPSIIIASFINPVSPTGWTGTKINLKGRISTPQGLSDGPFVEFMLMRARESLGMMAKMSEKQQKITNLVMQRDLEKVISSQSVDALMWDERLSAIRNIRFGKVKRNDPCPCGSGKKWKKCCYLTV